MEIERKFLLNTIPFDLNCFDFHMIQQAYLCTDPVVRIRKQDDQYYMTYKGKGFLSREEYNLPLNESAYHHLLAKADGNIITKKRYLIPLSEEEINPECAALLNGQKLVIELDQFDKPFAPLLLAEIEFPTEQSALAFTMPDWFLEDVTSNPQYHNSNMSRASLLDP